MKPMLTSLFVTLTIYAQALVKDTLYHVRFISTEDSSSLYFAPVKAISTGIHIASWQTDTNGYITIKRKEISRSPNVMILLNYPGFEKASFSTEKLSVNDTLMISVKPEPLILDKIQIISYLVPLIEKSDKPLLSGRHKESKKIPETSPVYSTKQWLAYEALQTGVWLYWDTLMRRIILAYDTLNNHYKQPADEPLNLKRFFTLNIYYPKQAVDFLMQETVYLSFELNSKGEISYIKTMKGQYPDLVLEAASILAKLPRTKLYAGFYTEEPFPRKPLKPVRFVLPLRFILN